MKVPTEALRLSAIALAFPRPGGETLPIVSDFDLTLNTCDFHCLAGRSGSGKTSLLRVAAAVLAPNAGDVFWAGIPLAGLTAAKMADLRRKHLGYVDQNATVIDELCALDNVLLPAVPLRIRSTDKERATELLASFGLADSRALRAGRLSGGERQRVAIARALLLKPTILALDEPTASLDRASADRIITAIHDAADDGCTVLVASHDPAVITAATSVTNLD